MESKISPSPHHTPRAVREAGGGPILDSWVRRNLEISDSALNPFLRDNIR